MSLDTYANLKLSIADWLNRSDLTTQIDDFITIAEARFRRHPDILAWLKTRKEYTNVTADKDVSADNVGEVLAAYMHDGAGGTYNHSLALLTREAYQQLMAENSAVVAPPQGVFVDRDEVANTTILRFYPPVSSGSPISKLQIDYVQNLPALSGGVNRLFTAAPDIYLFGALTASAPFLQHDERLTMWSAHVESAAYQLRRQAERREYGGAPRRMTLPRVFG